MIKFLILSLIKTYRAVISPLLQERCRFYPTCSAYSLSAVQKYGCWTGGVKSVKRLLKCHPWNLGGVDLP